MDSKVVSTITVTPVSPVIGAEIGGVDLGAALDDATVALIRRALLDHLVIFFRDQDITPEQQLAFAARFAPVMVPALDAKSDMPVGITLLDQTGPEGYNSVRWHSDSTFLEEPPLGAVLRGMQVPATGGDTSWTSMYAAYESLSPAMQGFLDGLHAVHSNQVLNASLNLLPQVVRRDQSVHESLHPVVRVHPETGRKALYVGINFVLRIAELSAKESDLLLGFLYEHVGAPDNTCSFHWEPNSVAMWDNRSSQHRAPTDYSTRRIMVRCLLQGDRPTGVS
jgi:alpha-ketoglutarate-dependent taurine dioxygenase